MPDGTPLRDNLVANQQSEALQKTSSAVSDVSLAWFGLRMIRAMQPSAARRRDR